MTAERRSLVLPVRKPFGLFATAISHGWYQTQPFRWDDDRRVLERAERLMDGRVMAIEMREAAVPERGYRGLELTISGAGAGDPGVAQELARRVRVMLHLDEDLRPFYAICRRMPQLRKAVRFGAGRYLRGSTLWEDIIKTILGTNVLWKQAVVMINRIAELGDAREEGATAVRAWPTPGQVVRAGERYLRDYVRAGYRTEYIMELALRQKSGDIDLDALEARTRRMTADDLFKKLTSIKGVGKSSAHFLMNLLGHYDHISIDSATYAYAQRALFGGRRPSEKQIRRRFAQFGKWQSLVYIFGRWNAKLAWWEDSRGRATL